MSILNPAKPAEPAVSNCRRLQKNVSEMKMYRSYSIGKSWKKTFCFGFHAKL